MANPTSDLKTRIIWESLRLFSLNGYFGTSMADILSASGTSKGGFYNHFSGKEDLFHAVLKLARRQWREKNLYGITAELPASERLIRLIENYRHRYLTDRETLPGGCPFIMFSAELPDRAPELAAPIHHGFIRLRRMMYEWIRQGTASGEFSPEIDPDMTTELLFSAMLGASLRYGVDKSTDGLARSLGSLVRHIHQLRAGGGAGTPFSKEATP